MTNTKTLNPQTIVQSEKTERAKKILFPSVTIEEEKTENSGFEKFSTAYENDKFINVLDQRDLNNYLSNNDGNKNVTVNPNTNKSFSDLLDKQNIKSVQTEQKVLSKTKIKGNTQVNAKINFRGKLILTAFCAITSLFGFLAIFNAFDIKNLNTDIQNLTSEVTQSEANLGDLWQTYSNLNNSNRITTIVENQNMSKINGENQIAVELQIKEKQVVDKKSNWFDAICDFFSGLFK